MKTTTKHQSYLATCSKKHFKIGLLFAIAFTIVAFKIPIYSSEPQFIIEDNYIEDEIWDIEYSTNIKQPKTPPTEKVFNKNIPPKLILTAEVPEIIDSISNIQAMDPEDFTLNPEPIIVDAPLPVITKKALKIADVMPKFIGGEVELFKYIEKNIKYNEQAVQSDIEGKVYVRFIVNKKGIVEEAEVVKGVHHLLDKEALKVVKDMPKWSPGMQNGKNVNVYMVIPINFVLS